MHVSIGPRSIVLAAAIATAGMTAVAGPVQADEKISLDYDFYGNGIRVLTLGFDVNLADGKYHARYKLKTKGLASIFSKGTTTAISQGRVRRNSLLVKEYTAKIKNSKGKRNIDITWGNGEQPQTKRSYDLGRRKSGSIKKVLKSDTPDPVTSMLQSIMFDAGKPCQGTQDVYDGKEVFQLKFEYLKRDIVPITANGWFSGPAYKCRLTYKPVAGLSKKKKRRLKKDPIQPFTVWMAPVKSPMLGKSLLMPVRATGRMKWANLEIFIRKGSIAGSPLIPTELAQN